MAEKPKTIYELIPLVSAEVGAVEKKTKNLQQGFMYRGIDAVMNALQPAFAKYGVFAVPTVLESHREERQTKTGGNLIYTILKMRYTFYAPDGSNVVAEVQGEAMDSADKSSNKAMSIAFKYACFQVLCIATEEMLDPDANSPGESKKIGNKSDTPEEQKQVIDTAVKPISTVKASLIVETAKKAKVDIAQILTFCKVATVEEIKEGQFETVMSKLKNTISDLEKKSKVNEEII